MRQSIAVLLIFSLCYQTFYNLGVTAYWVANRAYIAENLCENRDKPQMKCNGKCYLKKKMIDAPQPVQKSAPAPPQLKKGIEPAVLENAPLTFVSVVGDAQVSILIPASSRRYFVFRIDDIFHPPQPGC